MQDSLSLASAKLLFYRYKDTIYYPVVNVGILFAVGIVLLFQVVIPQFSQWFSVQREVDTIKGHIKTMQDNNTFLSSLDAAALDSDVETVSQAYPFENDYAGIIAALTRTASTTGVAIPDFSVTVGEPASGDLPIKYQMGLTFNGTLETAKQFITNLEANLPLAAVTSISSNGNETSVALEFYYHAFPAITINQKEKLQPLNAEEKTLLALLKSWQPPEQTAQVEVSQPDEVSSESGAFPSPL